MTTAPQYRRRHDRPGNAHALYEQRKAEWIRLNPDATPQQYTAAMRRIAHECGV
ncbi:MAG: hypothetical protein ABEH64_10170 [Salinirussus sp.]